MVHRVPLTLDLQHAALAEVSIAGPRQASTWVVVGLGRYARGRLLPSLSRTPQARLVGVYTRNPDVRRTTAEEYSVRAYDTYDAVLADSDVQIVCLATPHDVHAEQTIRAASSRKHVFVEKPMALSVQDAVRMQQECATAGVRLYVGFHLRFHEAHQRARELIRSGQMGDLVWVSARWASYRDPDTGWRLDPVVSGGTLLTARGVHLVDLIRFVCGMEFVTVAGESDGFRSDRPADDSTAALGRLSSGAIAHLLCSRLVRGSDDTLEVYGTQGRLLCRGILSNDPASSLVVVHDSNETVRTFPKKDMLAAELVYVSDAVAAGPPNDEIGATGTDGVRVTAVTTALVESIRNGRTTSIRYVL